MSTVTAAQWSDSTQLSIIATVDGVANVFVPVDNDNQDYQAVLAWVALGNSIAGSSSPAVGSTSGTFVDATFTLLNSLDSTKQAKFSLSGVTTGVLRTFALPNGNTTLVGTDFAQTLTNKSIDASANTLSNLATSMFASGVVDTDGTLAANSDTRIASQKAIKTYIGSSSASAWRYVGPLDCSVNPNYPSAGVGATYNVTVAGKIGGSSGIIVEGGDVIVCIATNAGGTQAAVGASWLVLQANIVAAITGPASSVSGNVPSFNGTSGVVLQDSGKAAPAGAFVGTTDTQTIQNKTLDNTNAITVKDGSLAIVSTSDVTKVAHFSVGALSTGVSVTYTMPGASTTILGHNATQTVSNKTLDDTNSITVKSNALIVEDSTDTSKKATFSLASLSVSVTRVYTLPDANTTLVGIAVTQTISNKTFDDTNSYAAKATLFTLEDPSDTTKKAKFSASGIATATTRTYTLPDANTTLVGTDAAQTLTNKSLTSPAITTPTGIVKGDVGLGNVDNTSDAIKNAASVTLSNKTIDGGSNTLTNLPNSAFANMPASTIKGNNNTILSAAPSDLTVAQVLALLPIGMLNFKITGVNFNSANTDTTIAITLPAGVTRWMLNGIRIVHASGSISTATAGVFSGAGGTGTTIAATQALTITSASADTNNNAMTMTLTNQTTTWFDYTTLYFRVSVAQGSAQTADVILTIIPMT